MLEEAHFVLLFFNSQNETHPPTLSRSRVFEIYAKRKVKDYIHKLYRL